MHYWVKHHSRKLKRFINTKLVFFFLVRAGLAFLKSVAKGRHFSRFYKKLSSEALLALFLECIRLQRNKEIYPRSEIESELSLELGVWTSEGQWQFIIFSFFSYHLNYLPLILTTSFSHFFPLDQSFLLLVLLSFFSWW